MGRGGLSGLEELGLAVATHAAQQGGPGRAALAGVSRRDIMGGGLWNAQGGGGRVGATSRRSAGAGRGGAPERVAAARPQCVPPGAAGAGAVVGAGAGVAAGLVASRAVAGRLPGSEPSRACGPDRSVTLYLPLSARPEGEGRG